MAIFILILLSINTYLTYKNHMTLNNIIQPLLTQNFDNTKIEDLEQFKDFFDINKH